jgi:hypothetical protein
MFFKFKIQNSKFKVSVLLLALLMSCKSNPEFTYQKGDLLFQDMDCGPMCDAIESVTFGIEDSRFSHIGLVVESADSLAVLEAIGESVQLTSIDEFNRRSLDANSNPKIWVGRFDDNFNTVVNGVMKIYPKYLGIAYDDEFLYNNGKYYCSELLFDIFKEANDDKAIFKLEPMTFKNYQSDEFNPVWVEYYKDLNMEIPEAELGINPAGISRNEKLTIVAKLGEVEIH